MAITITAIDGQTLNDTEGTVVHIERSTSSNAYTVDTTSRSRNRQTPVLTDERLNTRKRTFSVTRNHEVFGSDELEDFNVFVHEIFMPWEGERILYGLDHAGNAFHARIRIRRFGWLGGEQWQGEFEFITGVWSSNTVQSSSVSPITVTGNVFSQPIITLTGGTAIQRTRVTVTDRTGHGVMGLLIGVAAGSATASQNLVYINGVEIPFAVDSGYIFFRVSAPPASGAPPNNTFVDIFHGAAINNTTTAGELDLAGITLGSNIPVLKTYTTDPGNTYDHALSSALSWHPGIVTRHPRSRGYTFGFSGDSTVKLIDRQSTGENENLPDDADAFILTSPVEIDSIGNLNFNVDTGIVEGVNRFREPSPGAPPERVMRCTLAQLTGQPMPTNSYGTIYWSPTGFQFTTTPPPSNVSGGHNYPWYLQWTFGDTTFPHTFVQNDDDPDTDLDWERWYNISGPDDFQAQVEAWIGCTVTTGAAGVYYLHFPETSFHGIDIPLLSMSIGNRHIETQSGGDTNKYPADAGPKPAELFEAIWVDPETLEPLEDTVDNEEDLPGVVEAFVAYRTRDSSDWVKAWTQVVQGTSETINIPTISVPNAVQVAVGLAPHSASTGTVDWGELTFTDTVNVVLQSAKYPTIDPAAAVACQYIDGTLTNTTTGKSIQFTDVVGGQDGLVIDTENLLIESVVGPFYGKIKSNGGTRLFDLKVGANTWSKTFGGTATFEWRNREAS